MRLVSTMSWLVAPRCRLFASVSPTAVRSWRTSSGTTTPSRARPAPSDARSGWKPLQAWAIRAACSAGISPGGGLGLGQCALDPQHGGKVGRVGELGLGLGVADERGKERR